MRIGRILLFGLVAIAVGGFLFAWSGLYNVAASRGHLAITNAILTNSRTRFLVADASKWLGLAAVRVAPFSEFTYFVTDIMPPEHKNAESLTQSGVHIVLCAPPGR